MADITKTGNMAAIKTGIVGATLGAVAAGAAVYLSDKNNRSRVARKADAVKKKAGGVLAVAQKQVRRLGEETQDAMSEVKKELQTTERRAAARR